MSLLFDSVLKAYHGTYPISIESNWTFWKQINRLFVMRKLKPYKVHPTDLNSLKLISKNTHKCQRSRYFPTVTISENYFFFINNKMVIDTVLGLWLLLIAIEKIT